MNTDSILPKYRQQIQDGFIPFKFPQHGYYYADTSSYVHLNTLDKHEKSLDHIIVSWKKIFYERDLRKHNRQILENEKIQIRGYSPFETLHGLYKQKMALAKENDILREIITLTESQLSVYSNIVDLQIEILKNQLSFNEPDHHTIYIPSSINEWREYVALAKAVKEKILSLKNKVTGSISKFTNLVCRDIRQSFRNIIHFLFKNLDDESDSENGLSVTNRTKPNFISLLNFSHKWTMKNYVNIYVRL